MVHPDEYEKENSAKEELYNGEMFQNSLESLGLQDYSLGLGGDLTERKFVMAHVGKWKSPLYSKDKICCVYEVHNSEPINLETGMLLSDICDERPRKLTNNHSPVPSLKGQYLKVMECNVRTDENGTDYISPKTPSYWIPVEWVRQKVNYDPENTVLDK